MFLARWRRPMARLCMSGCDAVSSAKGVYKHRVTLANVQLASSQDSDVQDQRLRAAMDLEQVAEGPTQTSAAKKADAKNIEEGA